MSRQHRSKKDVYLVVAAYLVVRIPETDALGAEVVGVAEIAADFAELQQDDAGAREMAVAAVVAEI